MVERFQHSIQTGAIIRNDINEIHSVPVNITVHSSVKKVPRHTILIWDGGLNAYTDAATTSNIGNDTDFVITAEEIELTNGSYTGNAKCFTKASFDINRVYLYNPATNTFVFSPTSITAYKHPRFKINK